MSVSKEKVRKIIKKTGRFLMWTTGILLVICVGLYFTLRSPKAQTWISQQIADYMSDELGTTITIGGVNIQFFTSVVLEDFYVEDQHGDTLLFAPDFVVDISDFNYDAHYMKLETTTLTNANIKIKKYDGEKGLSFRFIQDYFESDDTTKTKSADPWEIELGEIKLENCRFAYIDTRYNDDDPGMDYENIQVRDLFVTLERLEPMGDSTSIFLSNLAAKERSGFEVLHMESRLMLADTFLKFNELLVQTPGSDIKGFIGFHFSSFDDVEDDFIHKVEMDGHFSECIVEMGDVAIFAPELLGIQKKVMLTGDVSGTVEKLKTRNMDLRFGKKSRIAGNFFFDGLPDIETTHMLFKFREASTNYEDLSGIPVAPFNDSSFLEVSSRIATLGDMVFTGSVEGFIHDFVAHGKLKTGQGNLVLENLAMVKDSTEEDYNWDGILSAEEFHIGNFLEVPEMGHITGTANMIGYGTDLTTLVATMNAEFSAFEFYGYRYSNITVTEGQLEKEVFDGKMTIRDPNINLDYEGFVDFKNPDDPALDFTAHVENANLSALGFADTSWHFKIHQSEVLFDMHGNNIDNLDGTMIFGNLSFEKNDKAYYLQSLSLESKRDAGGRELTFLSDFMQAKLEGEFQLLNLPDAVTDVMTAYLPAYFPPRNLTPVQKAKEVPQNFNWNITFMNNTEAVSAFVPGLIIAPKTFCKGSFNQANRNFDLFVRSDSICVKAYEIKEINTINAVGKGGKATLYVDIGRVQVNDSTGFDQIVLNSEAGSNILETNLQWDNRTAKENSGLLRTKVTFESSTRLKGEIELGTFYINDTLWTVDDGNMIYRDSSWIKIDKLFFRSGNQSIGVSGIVSHDPKDVLTVTMQRFNLSSANYVTEANGITVTGFVSGNVKLSELYDAPNFQGNADFDNLVVNKEKIGEGEATATWFPDKQAVYLTSDFWRQIDSVTMQPIKNIELGGWYYPKEKENSLDLSLKLTLMKLGLLKPAFADYCSKMEGYISTLGNHLKIKGNFSRPLIEGDMQALIRKVTIDYLGISVTAPWQAFRVENNSFYFDNFKLTDSERDTCVVYGNLYHDNFKKWQFDIDFSFDHFQVLNTTEKQNEDYYGRVYATGFMNIYGYVDKTISIDITAKTTGVLRNGTMISSDFNIPMSTASEAGSNEFIQFGPLEDDTSAGDNGEEKIVFNNNGIDLELNLEVTEQALVHIIFDETVGDELSAKGTGNLDIHIYPNGDFDMFGDYVVSSGDYLFTLKNIVYVPFQLQKDGVISWNGDPTGAHIDADAIYVAHATVEPFFPFDSTTAAYQQNYPVNVIMHLDGELANPGLAFDIELPTADPNIQETVRSYTQSELEMNRQVLSLMVLNSFMTPSEFRDGTETGASGNAGTTLLSNFVSGTLNNWLSQISDNTNVKFVYRPNQDMSLQELQLALNRQMLNNRLSIDVAGSVQNASQTDAQSNYNIVGNMSVEYKITEDGKVRVRAFSRGADNTDVTEGSQTSQGAGIFYREDFETFGELMRRYRDKITAPNPNRKPRPQPNDSIK